MLLTKIFIAPLFLLAATVNAGVIDYELTDLGSSNYRFDYTVNNTLGVDIEEITIFFDFTTYANLSVASSPTDWDSFVAQPDSALPDDGFFDSFALGTLIVDGSSLGGFSVTFDWIGGASGPQAQLFEINPFSELISGTTTPVTKNGDNGGSTEVTEPGTLILFALGLAGFALRRTLT